MNLIEPLNAMPLASVQTLVFAGGGNRCWWQAGLLSRLLQWGWELPTQLVGTSAGAAVATSFMADGPQAAVDACLRLYRQNTSVFEWGGRSQGRWAFAHRHTYPAWIESFLHAGNFPSVMTSRLRLQVGLTRLAPALGLAGSVAVGTLAYAIDKHVRNSIHPRLPRLLGLRQDFVDLHACSSVAEAQTLLAAAAAAPPFLPAQRISGALALDGGYADNAPIPAQSEAEKSTTLVLLTRHYPRLPTLFRMAGRSYLQPSQRVPVSTWDCTERTTVRDALSLGERDATDALNAGSLRI